MIFKNTFYNLFSYLPWQGPIMYNWWWCFANWLGFEQTICGLQIFFRFLKKRFFEEKNGFEVSCGEGSVNSKLYFFLLRFKQKEKTNLKKGPKIILSSYDWNISNNYMLNIYILLNELTALKYSAWIKVWKCPLFF